MPDKASQHLLPRVYLRAFADPSPPEGHPENRPFEPRIWLLPKSLEGPARGKSPQRAFTANRYYNLRGDDPAAPVIEESLGAFETQYGGLRAFLDARSPLTADQYVSLVLFIGTLRSRHPGHLDHWQKQWEELERIHRTVEKAHTGAEKVSDKRFWMKDETSKRQLFLHSESYASVVGPSGWLLANTTSHPFLTADVPAIHTFLHPDELIRVGFAHDLLPSDSTPAERAFFSYCPLSPALAFVSSPLLSPPSGSLYGTVASAMHVLMLNELMRSNCDKFVISPVKDPYGPLVPLLVEADTEARLRRENPPAYLLECYTPSNRFRIPCSNVVFEDGPTPLNGMIRFFPTALPPLLAPSTATVFTSITVYEGRRQMGGMRGARLLAWGHVGEAWLVQMDPALLS